MNPTALTRRRLLRSTSAGRPGGRPSRREPRPALPPSPDADRAPHRARCSAAQLGRRQGGGNSTCRWSLTLTCREGAVVDSTWVLLADEGRARILAMREPGTDLAEIEELIDPAAHARNADFRHDAYPRRGGGGEMRMGSDAIGSGGEDKLDRAAELFARRIADRLAQAH